MGKFEKSIEIFLNVVKRFRGASPKFSFDYSKEEIILIGAPSGFLKLLYDNPNVCGHLVERGIIITYLN